MAKLNCWEYMNCCQNNPNSFVDGKNTCPAYLSTIANGINDGESAGRACWVIAGSLSQDGIQGFNAHAVKSCTDCEFYKSVQKEEGEEFVTGSDLVRMLLER